MSFAKIRPRRGTLTDWVAENPILDQGEIALEYPNEGIGSGLSKMKIGDGIRHYSDLPYSLDATSAASIIGGNVSSFNLIELRAGTETEWANIDPIIAENEIVFDRTNNSIKIGDGIHRYSELNYINSGGTFITDYDFVNEDNIN